MASALAPRLLLPAALAALLLAASARAEEPIEGTPIPDNPVAEKVQLEYLRGPGAEDCPSERVLRHGLRTRMKANPFSPAARAKLRVRIVSVGGMYQASYEIIDLEGKVILPVTLPKREQCAIAVADVAFSAGVELPLFITGAVANSCEVPAPEEPRACEVPAASKPPAKYVLPFFLRAEIGALISVNSAPTTAGGFWAHGGIRWRFFSLSIGYRQELPVSLGSNAGRITVSRLLGEVVPCVHTTPDAPYGFFVCGLAQIGALAFRGETSDFDNTVRLWSVWAGVRAGFEVTPPIPHISFVLPVDIAGTVRGAPVVSHAHPLIVWPPARVITAIGIGAVFSINSF